MFTLIKNPTIINEAKLVNADVLLKDDIIVKIAKDISEIPNNCKIIDASGLYLLPGIIDTHVHFREPGLTHKADIFTESRAAAAGGVTSFIDMPNTVPPTTTNALLEEKFKIAAEKSLINYSFYLGATEENIKEIINIDIISCAGIKMFLGSSTGNLAVKNIDKIEEIFQKSPLMISLHCEDDFIIQKNLEQIKKEKTIINIEDHEKIRSDIACLNSTKLAMYLAEKYKTKINILHISTKKEMEYFEEFADPRYFSTEICVNYLWKDFYNNKNFYKNKIKCNPSIKNNSDREALIDNIKWYYFLFDTIISTDHAPHTSEEKEKDYLIAPSGIPSIQHSFQMILETLYNENDCYYDDSDLCLIVQMMCHNPAKIFNIEKRGFIRENYFADLVLIDLKQKTKVLKENILYKCCWSPLEGYIFNSKIIITFVNGKIVYQNEKIIENKSAQKLKFLR